MSVYIGGYIPEFSVKLNAQAINGRVLVPGFSGITTGQYIDASYTKINYTGATVGSQYNIQVVADQFVPFGHIPNLTLSCSPSSIATLDNFGNTTFVTGGTFYITGIYDSFSEHSGKFVKLLLNNTFSTPDHTETITYTRDPIDVSKHILIVYNTNSNVSTNTKTYYTGKRPLFSNANVLGISCPSGQEIISYSGFSGLIRQPIVNYLTGVSGTKPIRYVVMMSDIPTRVSDTNNNSISYQLYLAYKTLNLRNGTTNYCNQNTHFSLAEYQANTFLCSYINFGSYQDNIAYINKISQNQTGLYLTGNGQNTGYYFEDAGGYGAFPTWVSGRLLSPLLNTFSGIPYVYRANNISHIVSGNGLAGYVTWGANGGLGGNYANNGMVTWQGNNNWYIMHTIESFDGQRVSNQGNFIDWFSSGAFGGTGYENCPVGAVGYVEEPYLGGTENSGYYILWQSGFPFIECAWQGRSTNWFAAFGDPFVCK